MSQGVTPFPRLVDEAVPRMGRVGPLKLVGRGMDWRRFPLSPMHLARLIRCHLLKRVDQGERDDEGDHKDDDEQVARAGLGQEIADLLSEPSRARFP